jgi:hypothetical protein
VSRIAKQPKIIDRKPLKKDPAQLPPAKSSAGRFGQAVARKQLRAEESKTLERLCALHGYMFSDTLRAADRDGFMTNVNRGKMTIRPCVVIKLMVPADSALGVQIIAGRKERDPRESKAAKARAKAGRA